MVPGSAMGDPEYGVDVDVDAVFARIQSKLPVKPDAPSDSIARRRTCAPAGKETPVLVTVCHDCQPPVSGTVSDPVLSMPLASMWNLPPAPTEATRTVIV